MKTNRPKTSLVLSCIAAVAASQSALAELDPNQFAVGWDLELTSEGVFHDVPLTHEIYQFGRSLEELAVLDVHGTPMPFYRVVVPLPTVSEETTALDVSPIYVQEEGDTVAGLSVTTEGARTDVVVKQPDDSQPEAEIAAYIVDARDIERVPTAITVAWRPLERPFLMSVTIEHSVDLTNWISVGRGSVASLEIEGTSVTHGKIAIAGRERGFYRITWRDSIADWELEGVVVTVSAVTEIATFDHIEISKMEGADGEVEEDSLIFDVGGALPTVSVDLSFTNANQWINAIVYSAKSVDGPWRQRVAKKLYYDIDYDGQRLSNEASQTGRVETRYWKILRSPGIPSDDVRLRLTYPNERLRFAANGEPPYRLVGGTLSDEAGPDETISEVLAALDKETLDITAVRVGSRTTLGGAAALEIPTEFPWRTLILWLVLITAVLLVGLMAVRLGREMLAKD